MYIENRYYPKLDFPRGRVRIISWVLAEWRETTVQTLVQGACLWMWHNFGDADPRGCIKYNKKKIVSFLGLLWARAEPCWDGYKEGLHPGWDTRPSYGYKVMVLRCDIVVGKLLRMKDYEPGRLIQVSQKCSR